MSRRREKPIASYSVRVDDRVIVGFRTVPAGTKVVLAPDERAFAPCCIAVLGREPPYTWHEPTAPQFVADALGGTVEPLHHRPPARWDDP